MGTEKRDVYPSHDQGNEIEKEHDLRQTRFPTLKDLLSFL